MDSSVRTVVVLGGGTSDEREVSLRSATSVQSALEQTGYNTKFIDPKLSSAYLDDPTSIVLPILHGTFGEDGQVQLELEAAGIPYLGATAEVSKNCFDKWLTRKILQENNVPMAEAAYITEEEYGTHPLAQSPHVLKIIDGGSSIGTYIIREPSVDVDISKLFRGKRLILERLIEGTEITVAILDKTALPVVEIQPPLSGEFDYENKYNGKTAELCPAVSISGDLQLQAQALAERVHAVMQCRHFSRVDIMVDPVGAMYVLEINTIPGLTDQSLYPLAARVNGLTMPELITQLIGFVERDYSLQANS